MALVFNKFDQDGSGTISLNELIEAMGGRREAKKSVFVSLMKDIDKNGDGQIDLDELLEYAVQNIS